MSSDVAKDFTTLLTETEQLTWRLWSSMASLANLVNHVRPLFICDSNEPRNLVDPSWSQLKIEAENIPADEEQTVVNRLIDVIATDVP